MTGWREHLTEPPRVRDWSHIVAAAESLTAILDWLQTSDPGVSYLAELLLDVQLLEERMADISCLIQDRLTGKIQTPTYRTESVWLEQRVGGWHAEQHREWQ